MLVVNIIVQPKFFVAYLFETDDDSEWIPSDRITMILKAFKSKNILAVVDSCFS